VGSELAHPYESRTENHRFINETIWQTAVIKTDIPLTHQLYAACTRGKKWMKQRGE